MNRFGIRGYDILVDKLVVFDEKQLEILLGKKAWRKSLLMSITSAILAVDLFVVLYDFTWYLDDMTIYGLIFLTTLFVFFDILSIIVHYKKKQENIMELLKMEKQPVMKEIQRNIAEVKKEIREISWKRVGIFVTIVIVVSVLFYYIIYGGW